jgi:hypothetical protein
MEKDGKNELFEKSRAAKKAADLLFPGEKWIKWEDRIFVSSRRKTGKKTNFLDELKDAQILRDFGSTVYLVPENTRSGKKQYDAIVDGLKMEFKNMGGSSTETLIDHFYTSRKQAPNVFLNLENSPLSKHRVISILIGARNSKKYEKTNLFSGKGKIILKIKNHSNLTYLNVADL